MKEELRRKIEGSINVILPELVDIAQSLHDNPEIGGEEKMTSSMLIEWLEVHGFDVQREYCDIPYAYRAVCDSGLPGPTIGLFAEYDALPEIGHGCGHNLICTTSMGALWAIASVLDEIGGKVILFGTPGEENLQSKTIMAAKGAFGEIDVAMMVHPTPDRTAIGGRTLAIESVGVDFFGKSSHAGSAPEEGINALDAACTFYQMVGIQKQYYPQTSVYGVFLDGGKAPNIIPDFASLHYLVRAWDMGTIVRLKEMLANCAEAAAKMTGCTTKIHPVETNNAAMLSNQIMSKLFADNLVGLGASDARFADVKASTDMGDVSQIVPSIHPWVHLESPNGATLHSKLFADATVLPAAAAYLQQSAAALALTATDIMSEPELLKQIQAEFESKQ